MPALRPDRDGDWWRDAVIYHVYLRSFADSDGDGIGDLPGLLSRLDYLRGGEHSLGADTVWVSPFFPSPQADYGYDIADHLGVDPAYGSLSDVTQLIGELRRRDMRLIIDLVLNHTSTEHPWFAESRSDRDSARRGWYFWRPPAPGGGPPNNWLSAFASQGTAWTFDEATGEYYLSSFTPAQADVDLRHPAARQAMWQVVRTWLERGVDGFRVDVAHRLMKDPALADNPAAVAAERRHVSGNGARQHNFDHQDTTALLAELRQLIDAAGGTSVGEVPIHDHARLARYYGSPAGLHMLFTFGLWDVPWQAEAFRAEVEAVEASLPGHGWPCYALSNHDIPRLTDKYGGGPGGEARCRVAAVFLLTVRGTPCLYYGEEIGLTPSIAPGSPDGDDVDGRDPQRTPMQWEPGGGFTAGRPWLPPGAEPERRNVATQAADPGSLLSLYRRLIRLRAASQALRRGSYRTAQAPGGVLAYWREKDGEKFLIALNFTSEPRLVSAGGASLAPVLSSHAAGPALDGGGISLRPDEAVIARAVPAGSGPAGSGPA
ncbi:MAG TPA: alpha-amylase family glycosyl hydrolase [Streptosporangiaceae bacterium]|jgi:alpha-glucosidase